ncbi:shikimate dehydrogenase [Burkholderiales bacterium]|nr:shikimate dehydrogenase [Burkholderiales bacterium]
MVKPEQYVVIGNPIEHSKSPQIHSLFAQQTGISIEYKKLLCPVGDFSKVVSEFFASGGRGANVTVPFKLEAYEFSTLRSTRVEHAKAANTLLCKNGVISAENTDGIGLVRDIVDNLEFSIAGKSVLIVGSGGATRGVLLPILEELPKSIRVINRTPEKAHQLIKTIEVEARGLAVDVVAGGLHDLHDGEFDLVVNATSSSLSNDLFPLRTNLLGSKALAYDMMYGKHETSFTKWAQKSKAHRAVDGLGMLVEQAAESFFLWCDKRPDTQTVMKILRSE